MKRTRPKKLENLLELVKIHLANETYSFSTHALKRRIERSVLPNDVLYVLKCGYHEKKKDAFDEDFKVWKYAVRGKTLEGEDIHNVFQKLVLDVVG